jgi:hypothetical protein
MCHKWAQCQYRSALVYIGKCVNITSKQKESTIELWLQWKLKGKLFCPGPHTSHSNEGTAVHSRYSFYDTFGSSAVEIHLRNITKPTSDLAGNTPHLLVATLLNPFSLDTKEQQPVTVSNAFI